MGFRGFRVEGYIGFRGFRVEGYIGFRDLRFYVGLRIISVSGF